MVEETTLELLSGFLSTFLSSSLVSFPAPVGGLKGDPEVPKMGKYPVCWECSAGEECRREFCGERKGEDLSSALRMMWDCSCCSCWRWADWRAGWRSEGEAAPGWENCQNGHNIL